MLVMVRRIENAPERFGKVAIAMFRTRGYAETTVAQIAAEAGLTERTFYRYFADKAEVLFWRAGELQAEIVQAIAQARQPTPLQRVTGAMEAAGSFFDGDRVNVITRQKIIAAHDDFQERELMKMRSLAMAISAALKDQDVPEPSARMAAEAAVVIWRVAIDRWCVDRAKRKFPHHIRACLADLVGISHG